MANAETLYETLDVVLANLHMWNQSHYFGSHPERYRISTHIGDCGTTACIAGFRCLMDGLVPQRHMPVVIDPSTGNEELASDYARERFGLTEAEAYHLFHYYTRDPAKLKQRVDEIVAGEWDTWDRDTNPPQARSPGVKAAILSHS